MEQRWWLTRTEKDKTETNVSSVTTQTMLQSCNPQQNDDFESFSFRLIRNPLIISLGRTASCSEHYLFDTDAAGSALVCGIDCDEYPKVPFDES